MTQTRRTPWPSLSPAERLALVEAAQQAVDDLGQDAPFADLLDWSIDNAQVNLRDEQMDEAGDLLTAALEEFTA